MTDTDATRSPRLSRHVRRTALVVVLALGGFLVWRQWFETYHLVVVDEGKVYRDGNRSLREFKNSLRKTDAKTVVAILDDKEYHEPEFVAARELVKSRGLGFHWIPIRAGWYPTADQVREFLAIANDPAKQPVLYHDDEGIRRAGMMMAAYQQTVLGFDDEKTKAAMQTFGHSDRTINEVRRFIDVYDPANGLTVDLNAERAALLKERGVTDTSDVSATPRPTTRTTAPAEAGGPAGATATAAAP